MSRMPPNDEKKSFADSIRFLSNEDFDGHTGFSGMNPEERLMWLSQAVQFFYEHNRKNENVFTAVADSEVSSETDSVDR